MSQSAKALAKNGVFHQTMVDFIPRDAQQQMASAVEDTLQFNGRLVVESGTGTGKTFAYLVPVILSGKRTIISTGTKHLQEQIFHRDLPAVLKILGVSSQAQLLKGRSNYLCRYRLRLNSEQSDFIGKANDLEFDVIDKWATTTRSGDIAEISDISESSPIWHKVTSTANNCLGGKCPDYSNCFVNQARQRAMQADIVVVNHHLFFSDLTLKTEGFGELLPDQEAVIFDEAHSVPEIASRFFGFSISSFQISELLKDTIAAEKEENSSVDFSDAISTLGRELSEFQNLCKSRKISTDTLSVLRSTDFDSRFEAILQGLNLLEVGLDIAAPAGEGLDKCHNRCLAFVGQLSQWWENRDHNSVSWIESNPGWFRLHLTPINIGEHLSTVIDNPNMSWTFTSATLAVGSDFSSFCDSIGIADADTHTWQSPYDFSTNSLIYLPENMPDPRHDEFFNRLVRTIIDVTNLSRGRAFCLFTSHYMLDRVYTALRSDFEWPLFVQGQAAKQQLIEQFLQRNNSVLLGTSSFWEGVDVKGDMLSCVIIDKLPFASPSDPVFKSKLKNCEESGGNPFMDIQVPEAVISLKQGAGRLIRSETDRGVLVLCDSRLSSKAYGKMFIKSLPPMPITTELSRVARFFS